MSDAVTTLKFFGKEALQGGLNVTDNPIIVPPNQMVIAKNVAISRTLARKKRGGLDRYTTSSYPGTSSYPAVADPATSLSAVRGVIQYYRYGSGTGEANEDIFLHQGTKLWSIESRTSVGVDRTGALSVNSDAIPSYQVFEGILYFCDTEQTYRKWNALGVSPGNATAAIGPESNNPGKFIRAHQGRMWMAGNTDFPFRLYYSSALDAEDWSSVAPSNGGSLDLTSDGDPEGITAIFPPFQGRLYVATRRRIYEITGSSPDDFVVRAVTQGIGCVGHNSVAATPNDVIFASDRGVHSLIRVQVSDQSEVTFLSRDIQTLWTTLLNRQLLNRCQAVYDEVSNSYIITCVGSGSQQNTITLVYNIEFGTWTTWDGLDARSVNAVLVSGQQYVLCGREDGEIAFINENKQWDLDATDGFPFQFKTGKIWPGNEIDTQFRVHSVTVLMSATRLSNCNISWELDSIDGQKGGSAPITLGQDTDLLGSTFTLGTSRLGFGQFLPVKSTVDETGYNIQISVTATGTSDIEFYGFILEVSSEESHTV